MENKTPEPEQELLPKPQTDLPLPEKEIPAHIASQGHALQNKTKWLILSLILVTITLVGIAGGKYYLNQQKLKAINDFESCATAGNPIQESYPATCRTSDGRSFTQILSEDEQKNLLPPDPTANWKTYENTDLGFYLKYPSNWDYEIKPNSTSPILKKGIKETTIDFGITDTEGEGADAISPHIGPGYVVLHIIEYSTDVTKDPKSYIDPNLAVYVDKSENTVVNNIKSQKISHSVCQSPSCSDILIPRDKTIFDFSIINGDEELNQILSTFKFIDQQLSCTPRPACLDSNPRCMIAETADMCPPSPTPNN